MALATVGVEQEMLRRRAAGDTLREIGETYGLSHEWVRQICERAGVKPQMTCRRCGDPFLATTKAGARTPALCPGCRARRCVVCGEGFSRDQLGDDGDAHKGCRRVSRGSRGGTTYRAVERGVYRRTYKETGVVLDGFFVARRPPRTGFDRYETLHDARVARADAINGRNR